jgi:hypothetical protein
MRATKGFGKLAGRLTLVSQVQGSRTQEQLLIRLALPQFDTASRLPRKQGGHDLRLGVGPAHDWHQLRPYCVDPPARLEQLVVQVRGLPLGGLAWKGRVAVLHLPKAPFDRSLLALELDELEAERIEVW